MDRERYHEDTNKSLFGSFFRISESLAELIGREKMDELKKDINDNYWRVFIICWFALFLYIYAWPTYFLIHLALAVFNADNNIGLFNNYFFVILCASIDNSISYNYSSSHQISVIANLFYEFQVSVINRKAVINFLYRENGFSSAYSFLLICVGLILIEASDLKILSAHRTSYSYLFPIGWIAYSLGNMLDTNNNQEKKVRADSWLNSLGIKKEDIGMSQEQLQKYLNEKDKELDNVQSTIASSTRPSMMLTVAKWAGTVNDETIESLGKANQVISIVRGANSQIEDNVAAIGSDNGAARYEDLYTNNLQVVCTIATYSYFLSWVILVLLGVVFAIIIYINGDVLNFTIDLSDAWLEFSNLPLLIESFSCNFFRVNWIIVALLLVSINHYYPNFEPLGDSSQFTCPYESDQDYVLRYMNDAACFGFSVVSVIVNKESLLDLFDSLFKLAETFDVFHYFISDIEKTFVLEVHFIPFILLGCYIWLKIFSSKDVQFNFDKKCELVHGPSDTIFDYIFAFLLLLFPFYHMSKRGTNFTQYIYDYQIHGSVVFILWVYHLKLVIGLIWDLFYLMFDMFEKKKITVIVEEKEVQIVEHNIAWKDYYNYTFSCLLSFLYFQSILSMGIPSFVFGLYHATSKLMNIPRTLHISILLFFLFQIWYSEVRQQFQFFLFGLFYCHPKTRDIFNYDTLQEILLFIVCDIVVIGIFFSYCGDYVKTGNRRY